MSCCLPNAEDAHTASVQKALKQDDLKRQNADRDCSKKIELAIRSGKFAVECSYDVSQKFASLLKEKRYSVQCDTGVVYGERLQYCLVRWEKT